MTGRFAPHPFFAGAPHLIAHRGGSALAPENTMVAFEQAVTRWGADIIEIDVHASADGHCVVIHDATVDRTTNGTGEVASMTLDELRALDAGFRFVSLDGEHSFRGKGVTIPTIEEVIDAFPDMRFIIEVKAGAAQAPLFSAIDRVGAHQRILAAGELDRNRDLFPLYPGPTSESGDRMRTMYKLHRLHLMPLWRAKHPALQLPLEHEGRRVVTERLVRELERKGLVVQVWTVNDPADMRTLLEWGVDGVLSDRPDLLKEVMGR